MSPSQFDQAVNDLVNFLAYTAEPQKGKRYSIGIYVMLFLVVFAVISYLLKREFWRDIK
jgi:ubiquinol-cytochrome c reductase cytochrome c1 subunit